MKTTFSPRPRLGAVILALGLAFGATAATAESATPGQVPVPETGQRMAPKGHHMGHGSAHHMGRHDGHHLGQHGERGMRGLMRLHDELKLDARQEALWKDAANASREARTTMGERMRKERTESIAALNQPGADLRAIVKRMDATRAQGRTQHEAMQERWLAVYDSLAPEQKEKARVFVKAMFERGERRGHHGRHGGPGRQGQPGQPGAQPAPRTN